MNGQDAARHQVGRPAAIVAQRRLQGVAAIDEQQGEGRRPVTGHDGGSAHHGDDRLFQTRRPQGAPKGRQGVETSGGRVP